MTRTRSKPKSARTRVRKRTSTVEAGPVKSTIKRTRTRSRDIRTDYADLTFALDGDYAYSVDDSGVFRKVGEAKVGRIVCCFSSIDGQYNEVEEEGRGVVNRGTAVKIVRKIGNSRWLVRTPQGHQDNVYMGCCFPTPPEFGKVT